MTKHFTPPLRGLIGVRADAPDVTALMATLQETFTAFRAENDKAIADIRAGMEDVVQIEKVDRINASIGEIQAAIDDTNARLAAIAANGAGEQEDEFADPAYRRQFSAYFRNGRNDSEIEAAQNQGVRAAMTVAAPAEGGYLAPTEWDRTIVDRLKILSPWRTIARVQQIGGNGFTRLYNDRGTTSGWVGEAAARPNTANARLSSLAFNSGEIYANPVASQRILDDALVDVEAWLADEVETEFALQEGVAFTAGDGVNKPDGILTYAAGGANENKHPWGAIPEVVSGAAGAITADGIWDLVYDLPSERTAGARFVMNRKTMGAVRKLKDADGEYLWRNGIAEGQPATLAGFPVTEIAAMPDVAANATPIAFGDFQRGYLIIDRVGVRVLRDPFTAKPNVQFYTTKRVGGGVNDPEAMRLHRIAA